MLTTFTRSNEDCLIFSILVTGKCNCSCSYCHYYATHGRKNVMRDISDEVFDHYINTIKIIKERYHNNIQVRFSGGEPLTLNEKLFDFSNRIYSVVGEKPYILTNGALLDKEIVKKSKQNNIGAFLVSIENPYDVDNGSVDPRELVSKIKLLNSKELPIIPGCVIIKNNMFQHITKICDFFYSSLGEIPTLIEMNFDFYKSPSNEELNCLYNNLVEIMNKYFSLTPIQFFPYIVPELIYVDKNPYIIELDLMNSLSIDKNELDNSVEILRKQLDNGYVDFNCEKERCDWRENCSKIHWLWTKKSENTTVENKLKDYCRFKNVISSAYYTALESLFKDAPID